MTGFLIAAAFVGWFVALFFLLWLATEVINPVVGWVFVFAWSIFGLGVLINGEMAADAKGPCVESEIQMHYNAATKTMMPAKVCILRGEWVEGAN